MNALQSFTFTAKGSHLKRFRLKQSRLKGSNFRRRLCALMLMITCIFTLSLSQTVIATEDLQELQEFLTAEQAFTLNAKVRSDHKIDQIELHFGIAPGYQLYREHFKFRTLTGENFNAPANFFPETVKKHDDVLGDYHVYSKDLILLVDLDPKVTTSPQGIRVEYQGCAESGFCYAPINKEIVVFPGGHIQISDITVQQFTHKSPSLANTNANTSANTNSNASEHQSASNPIHIIGSETSPVGSEVDGITTQLQTGTLPMTLLVFLGLGILLAFTPCVLPMVPILANILVGDKVPLTSRRAALLASLYIFSLALCYAIAGVVAGLLGNEFQLALQKPIFIISLSFILLLFALSQFNLIHIQMPPIFGEVLHRFQYKQKQGSVFGAIAMGGISAVMVSPCVTPALVGALTYIGQTGNALLGGLALFAMAIGMGLPLIVVACVGSHLLPKAGKWMVHLKTITGVFLLILAGFILMRAFPHTNRAESLKELTHFTNVQTVADLDKAIITARSLNKPIILDVYADWCVSCQQIDKEIFGDQKILDTLKETTLLRFDITELTKDKETLRKSLNIIGPPTLLFFSLDGHELKNYRLVGKQDTAPFMEHLKQFLKTRKVPVPRE